MSFIEVESWEIGAGNAEAHHESIRRWFAYVREHHADMFAEWKSTRYFRQLSAEGHPSGRYIMMFEFSSRAGRDAYKVRRRTWDSYAQYRNTWVRGTRLLPMRWFTSCMSGWPLTISRSSRATA
jgi:hypothetical protein